MLNLINLRRHLASHIISKRVCSLSAPAIFFLGTLVLLFLGGLLTYFTRGLYPLPQFLSPHDLGVFLDHGWRLSQGQMPHRDYSSFLGPLWAFLTFVPIYLWGAFYESYTLYPAIVSVAFGFLTYISIFSRLSFFLSIFYSIIVALVAGGTYHIGWDPELLTYSTNYNRIGFSFFLIISFISFSAPVIEGKASERCRGLLCGLLVGVLLFLKVNFFAVSLMFLFAGCISHKITVQKEYLTSAIFGLIISISFGFYLIDWSVSEYIRDMELIAAARSGVVTFFNPITILASNDAYFVLLLAIICILFFQNKIYAVVVVLFITTGTILLGLSQSSGNGFALPGFLAALFVAGSWMSYRHKGLYLYSKAFSVFSWISIAIYGFMMIVLPQIRSYHTWSNASFILINQFGPPSRDILNPLSPLFVRGPNFSRWGGDYPAVINEARALVAQRVLVGDTVHLVDLTNPLNFGSFNSARGTYVSVDSRINISNKLHLPPEIVLSNIDLLIVAKYPDEEPYVLQWSKLYGASVDKMFTYLDQSDRYILFRRVNKQ